MSLVPAKPLLPLKVHGRTGQQQEARAREGVAMGYSVEISNEHGSVKFLFSNGI